MAIVATPVITGSQILLPATPQYKSWTITALDADLTVSIPHGFTIPGILPVGVAAPPDYATIQNLVTYATGASPSWGVSVVGANIVLTKTANAGSGGAVPGTTIIAKLYAEAPHTIFE
jgi:hypothetical protein